MFFTVSESSSRCTAVACLHGLSCGWQHRSARRALPTPDGPVVLTVTGRVREPNRGAAALFDMAMLARLPQASFSTRTPWYAQARKFTGPLLRDVLTARSGGRPGSA